MPDSKDRLLINLSKAKLYIHLAALDTHDKMVIEGMLKIHLALQNLSHDVNDQRSGTFDSMLTRMPSECSDCANGIKHPHPVVRKRS